MTALWLSSMFFQALNTSKLAKLVFCRGVAPDPAGEAYDAPPDRLVVWGGAGPRPHTFPAF